MNNSDKLSSHSRLTGFLKVLPYTLIIFLTAAQSLYAQDNFVTPVIDGVIHAQQLEYGNNEEDHDRRHSGPVTWWVAWDNTNFYIATDGAPVNEGAVCYFDRNPIAPTNSGTNIDGTLTGFNFDSARYGVLPFRSDFVAYFSTVKREWHTTDLAGGWTAATLGGGSFASVGTQREYGIPWNAITSGNGRPTRFLFLCYGVSAGGSVYGQIPLENPAGVIGQNATATHFYRIFNSIDPINKPPFSTVNTPTFTAAMGTINGSVSSKTGRNVSKVEVLLVGGNGELRTAITNPFGNFVFTDVPFGSFYVVQINSGKHNMVSESRSFQFLEDINDLNFMVQ